MGRNDHDRIPHLDAVLAAWNDNGTVSVDKRDQKVFLQGQLSKGNIGYLGFFIHAEFNGFRPVIKHVVKGFDIAVHRIFFGTDISNDSFRGNIPGVDQAA